MSAPPGTILPLDGPVTSLDEYLESGGGRGLAAALGRSPEEVIEEVRRSGLRGRGGAGFPTGMKWRTVREDPCPTRYVLCNAAEGEPGTFKDRWLLRMNPYQAVEGLAIAAHAVGAERAFIGIKAGFRREIDGLRRAMEEMSARDLTGPVPIELVGGPVPAAGLAEPHRGEQRRDPGQRAPHPPGGRRVAPRLRDRGLAGDHTLH